MVLARNFDVIYWNQSLVGKILKTR